MNKSLIRGLFLTGLAGVAGSLSGCGEQAQSKEMAAKQEVPAISVETAAVTSGALAPTYAATTHLEAEREAKIVTEVPGEVVQVLVEEGDRVAAGQVLARVDSARVAMQLRQAQSVANRMEHDVARGEQLVERHMISRTAYDQAKYDRDTQTAAVGLARLSVSKTEIRAPYAGVITRRHVKQGMWLNMQAVAFEIADFDDLRARIDVPERVSGLIKPGQGVAFTVDALPGQPFNASVDRVSPVVDRTSGTVGAIVSVDNREGTLRPGLFVRLEVNYQNIANATLLPKTAVMSDAGSNRVFVVEDGIAHRRDVQLGVESGSLVQAIAGVEPGASVVVLGQSGLKDGDRVQVVNPAAAVEKAEATAAL
jgi:membrane fusion protein, multidrug efflux system